MKNVNKSKIKYLNSFLDFILETLAIICVFGVLFSFFGYAVVHGKSMEPTYREGKIVFYYHCSSPKQGDIIIAEGNGDDYEKGEHVIKRVIATGGDTIEIKNNNVYINDKIIDEPYIKGVTSNFDKITVPDGYIFVMGDNRENSLDSRKVGCIPLKEVLGKVA